METPRFSFSQTQRCPISRDTSPQNGAIPKRVPPFVLSLTQAHLCDTSILQHIARYCAIPPKQQARKSLSIARYEKHPCWASKPPKLAFWDFLAVLILAMISLLLLCVVLSFPKGFGFREQKNPFPGFSCFFLQRSNGLSVRGVRQNRAIFCDSVCEFLANGKSLNYTPLSLIPFWQQPKTSHQFLTTSILAEESCFELRAKMFVLAAEMLSGPKNVKVARLQSEFCTKDFFRATNFLTKNAPKFSPKFLSLCSVGQKKSPENSLQISH